MNWKWLIALAITLIWNQQGWTQTQESECPNGLNCVNDFYEGLRLARESDKPMLVHFTAWATSSRKMEEVVWSDPAIQSKLNENTIVVILYLDEREPLPEALQVHSEVLGKTITQVGQRWRELEITHFEKNSQPLYAFFNPEGQPFGTTQDYNPNVGEMQNWINANMNLFRTTQQEENR